MTNLVGASVNAAGTLIATAKALGSGSLDLTNSNNDAHTVITVGSMQLTVKGAIAEGLLQRNSSGVLVELNPSQQATRVDA